MAAPGAQPGVRCVRASIVPLLNRWAVALGSAGVRVACRKDQATDPSSWVAGRGSRENKVGEDRVRSDRIEAKWIDAFEEVFRLSGLGEGDAVALLSETQALSDQISLSEQEAVRSVHG